MTTYEIRWTREQWFKVTIEANNPVQAEAMFWDGNYENEQMYGSEIQANLEVFEVVEMDKKQETMATVNDLIGYLNEVEDKNQPIIYTYFLAEHFDLDGEQPTLEQFTKTAEALNDLSLWDDAGETINDYICGMMYREKEDSDD